MNIDFWLKESNEIVKEQLKVLAFGLGLTKVHGKCPIIINNNGVLAVRFSYGKKQSLFSPGLPLSQVGISQCRSLALEIGQKLLLNEFSYSWLESKKVKATVIAQEKNIFLLWCEFKQYFLSLKKNNKLSQVQMWQNRKGDQLDRLFHNSGNRFKNKYRLDRDDCQWLLNHKIIKVKGELIILPDDTTRSNLLKKGMLKSFLEYCDHPVNVIGESSKRWSSNQFESSYCTDDQILQAINKLQDKITNGPKRFKPNNQGWLCFLKVVAVYGLRPHEFWNIKNWDTPVRYWGNDYKPDPAGAILAITDPSNNLKVLAIGKDTKTGGRLVLPVLPQELNLSELFSKPLDFPLITDPLGELSNGGYKSSDLAGKFFLRSNIGFNPYQLRHAYAHRCDRLSIRPNLVSKSMGHSLNVHNQSYLSTFNQDQLLSDYQQELGRLDPLDELKKRLSASFSDSQVKSICDIVQSVLMSNKTL